MAVLQVFDPPMCCSTGVCGPKVDPALARFAADLVWLRSLGVAVQRFNLAQEPNAFADTPAVQQMLEEAGPKCLPMILLDGRVVSQGVYPSREDLGALAGIGKRDSANMRRTLLPVAENRQPNGGTGCCGGSGCCG